MWKYSVSFSSQCCFPYSLTKNSKKLLIKQNSDTIVLKGMSGMTDFKDFCQYSIVSIGINLVFRGESPWPWVEMCPAYLTSRADHFLIPLNQLFKLLDLPWLMMGLHPDKPVIMWKHHKVKMHVVPLTHWTTYLAYLKHAPNTDISWHVGKII